MNIIKLNAIDSTNSYLRNLSLNEKLEDFTVVTTDFQTHGKGQMGTKWSSQEGKNLIFSIFKDFSEASLQHHFYISIVVSLSIVKALEIFQIQNLKIKWPNDILSDNKKIAGILIENVIKQNKLQASIIGIGLNVNQTDFEQLPNASSMRLISGRVFDRDEVLQEILNKIKNQFELMINGDCNQLKTAYEDYLFRKNRPSTFKDVKGEFFPGIIIGVDNTGNLQVQIEESVVKEFDLKEITLLY